jgi:2-keto-3-deoxy-L-rhamnonate aldolase RhmA
VETALALSRIEEIAATDGVDGLFIGPADLAASMGHPGALDHPAVKAAIEDAIRRITATGKPAGILTSDAAFARACMGWGTRFTAVGMDIGLSLWLVRLGSSCSCSGRWRLEGVLVSEVRLSVDRVEARLSVSWFVRL